MLWSGKMLKTLIHVSGELKSQESFGKKAGEWTILRFRSLEGVLMVAHSHNRMEHKSCVRSEHVPKRC